MELKDAIIDYVNNIDEKLTYKFIDCLFDLIEDSIPSPYIKTHNEIYYAVIVDNIIIGIDVYKTHIANTNIYGLGIIYSGKRLAVNRQFTYYEDNSDIIYSGKRLAANRQFTYYEDNSDIIDKLHQYFNSGGVVMFVDTIRSTAQNGRTDLDLNWLFTTTQCKSAKKISIS